MALAIRKPWRAPQPAPVSMPSTDPMAIAPQPAFAPPWWMQYRSVTTPASTSTEPTDRSMPAVRMTNVCPTAMTR